jgi:hypothetical protein
MTEVTPGDVGRVVARQEGDQVRDFLGSGESSRRGGGRGLGDDVAGFDSGRDAVVSRPQFGLHRTWTDGVDGKAWAEFLGQGLGEGDQSGLGRAVVDDEGSGSWALTEATVMMEPCPARTM